MATPPTPHTWTAGDDATSGFLQTETTVGAFLLSPPRAYAFLNATYTIGSGNSGVELPIPMVNETFDVDVSNMHSTTVNTSRITAVTTGLYLVIGQITHAATNTTGLRGAAIWKNGAVEATDRRPAGSSVQQTPVSVSKLVQLTAGDYVELYAYENSGVAADVVAGANATFLQVLWVASS